MNPWAGARQSRLPAGAIKSTGSLAFQLGGVSAHDEIRQKEERQRSQAYQDWLREDLLRVVNARRDAKDIRAFLAGMGTTESGNKASEAWIEWAKWEADRIDPLSGSNSIARSLDPPESWSK